MIKLIESSDYGNERAALNEVYRLRHRVFRERMKWDVHSRGGMETDEFDALRPSFLVAMDGGAVVGTWRLLPTTGTYMLKDVFSFLLDRMPAPEAPDIWETSRFAVDHLAAGEVGSNGVGQNTNELFCALVELCLARGIREVVQVYDIRVARLLPRIGCRPFWQSRRQRIGNTIALAGRFTTDERSLATIRKATGICHEVLAPQLAQPRDKAA